MSTRTLRSTTVLKRTSAMLLVVGLLAMPQAALAWGTATHVYIAKKLGHQLGYANIQEMYGATLTDFPNLMFGSPYQDFLFHKTHYDFMQFVRRAPFAYQRAMGYGFASHNEAWGADYSAHIQSLTLGGPGGYVNKKIPPLAGELAGQVAALLNSRGIFDPDLAAALTRTLADTCIESAVDIRISQQEFKEVGVEMMLASGLRAPFAPSLLTSAYAKDLAAFAGIGEAEASAILTAAEAKNRQYVTTYGAVLTQPNRTELLAGLIAQLAVEVLPALGDPNASDLVGLIGSGLEKADLYVQADYSAEVEATLDRVGKQLLRHWVFTSLIP